MKIIIVRGLFIFFVFVLIGLANARHASAIIVEPIIIREIHFFEKECLNIKVFPEIKEKVIIKVIINPDPNYNQTDQKEIVSSVARIFDLTIRKKGWERTRFKIGRRAKWRNRDEWQKWAEKQPIDIELNTLMWINLRREVNVDIISNILCCRLNDPLEKKYMSGGKISMDNKKLVTYFKKLIKKFYESLYDYCRYDAGIE